ncbi:predicted integral membrane protein [Serpentinimonas raichei]|jgi:YggT family protein|uniref:Predicted integral membrane protein n=1 Tax=Serpentinimonas raichei TaxID=1458425 RepID=A0A060NG21_9BURK|nr:YggT family protein [Serpentinimonas raichei]MDO8274598.1 YggT family protein [Serpentinimonas sp.]BAO80566.1 predicted integral membrane protein [Serpentinimonas raichei]
MSALLFLLNTLFFFLVGAALLRAWMNTRRMRMVQQPGPFVMAVTNWIVQPLRKSLPQTWVQSQFDVASFIAACLLALAYSAAWHTLFGAGLIGSTGTSPLFSVPFVALNFMLRTVLQGLMVLALVYVVLSWVQPQAPVQYTLGQLLQPLLAPIRRVLPTLGGVDLSVLLLIVLLQVALILIG